VSLRPVDFRRFQIGILPGGKEEWLEFWFQNHRIAGFPWWSLAGKWRNFPQRV